MLPVSIRRFFSSWFNGNDRNQNNEEEPAQNEFNNPENEGGEAEGQQFFPQEDQPQFGGIDLGNQNLNDNQADLHSLWRSQQEFRDSHLNYWDAHAEAEERHENEDRNPRYAFDHSSSYIL